jgi:hypothetical protein
MVGLAAVGQDVLIFFLDNKFFIKKIVVPNWGFEQREWGHFFIPKLSLGKIPNGGH